MGYGSCLIASTVARRALGSASDFFPQFAALSALPSAPSRFPIFKHVEKWIFFQLQVTRAEAKGKSSKRKRKVEAPKESVREKKRSEKERRAQLDLIHTESQRLLRETRSASFRLIVQPVCKPISSVLEKIRLRKLEVLKNSNTTAKNDDDNAAASEPVSDYVVHVDVP
ncbi:hypothetical protein PVAP13_5NG295842 [Panicum virgatum]|uniref:Uncharacterized protein n=1 Tax=Panicum virgatum TaxID=38727 RepID=A0A8T0RZ22_PANVG|nr:hypothetical protein PVAP13_5NG295842 [Panicum virgatum]KAG2589847.1 hypothetical protein PVAP13_5NG295842 [Panicum virgatum]KAG2589848.1 hypothetical protein PVAP13_5NG295842 [Panicum virgatum]